MIPGLIPRPDAATIDRLGREHPDLLTRWRGSDGEGDIPDETTDVIFTAASAFWAASCDDRTGAATADDVIREIANAMLIGISIGLLHAEEVTRAD